MRFPRLPVSVLAYDEVKAERDRLRAQVDSLMDSLLRISRHEVGMPEVERQARRLDVTPMPKELAEHFASFWNQPMAKMMRAQAYRRHGRGELWEQIMKDVMEPEEPQAAGG